MAITSIGFIGSGQLAERIARKLITKIPPQQKFSYRKQRLVNTLLASDPSEERRQVFNALGFTTTETNQQILSDCDLVFIGTNIREALANVWTDKKPHDIKQTLFVSLMGDLSAQKVEQLICPGARVIRIMPQNYLEQKGLPKGVLPPSSWATTRSPHTSHKDVQKVMELVGISQTVDLDESNQMMPLSGKEKLIYEVVEAISAHLEPMEVGEVHDEYENDILADFHDTYEMGEVLGQGAFSQVIKATHKETGEVYAVKCLKDEKLTKEGYDILVAELGALNRLTHDNIIGHHGFYSEGDNYFLVLDYCDQGTLRQYLKGKLSLPEAEVKHIIRQVLKAIEYCHSMGQVHRDIKPENILLSADKTVKLADFGFSVELELSSEKLMDVCGTPHYLSPEIVSGRPYGKPADIWSTGIMTYSLLSGHVPFEDAHNQAELDKLISLGAIWYDQPIWATISPAAKDFMQKILDISPDSRPTATELLAHEWLEEA